MENINFGKEVENFDSKGVNVEDVVREIDAYIKSQPHTGLKYSDADSGVYEGVGNGHDFIQSLSLEAGFRGLSPAAQEMIIKDQQGIIDHLNVLKLDGGHLVDLASPSVNETSSAVTSSLVDNSTQPIEAFIHSEGIPVEKISEFFPDFMDFVDQWGPSITKVAFIASMMALLEIMIRRADKKIKANEEELRTEEIKSNVNNNRSTKNQLEKDDVLQSIENSAEIKSECLENIVEVLKDTLKNLKTNNDDIQLTGLKLFLPPEMSVHGDVNKNRPYATPLNSYSETIKQRYYKHSQTNVEICF